MRGRQEAASRFVKKQLDGLAAQDLRYDDVCEYMAWERYAQGKLAMGSIPDSSLDWRKIVPYSM